VDLPLCVSCNDLAIGLRVVWLSPKATISSELRSPPLLHLIVLYLPAVFSVKQNSSPVKLANNRPKKDSKEHLQLSLDGRTRQYPFQEVNFFFHSPSKTKISYDAGALWLYNITTVSEPLPRTLVSED
jgi:hypothetical protein